MNRFFTRPAIMPAAPVAAALVLSVSAFGCNQVQTNASEATAEFQGTAITTYTWQVEYIPTSPGQDRPNDRRLEQFESTTLTTTNGIRPDAAGSGPDSKGLWWPTLPPEPTVDDIESRLRPGETARSPEIIKSADYTLSFNQAGEEKTLPTDYEVYREAVKAFERGRPLQLTLGPQDNSVIQAEIQ
ncbi:hypothetical protein S7335_4344 [Synechococcus sp. PCC 7335]|uniref:hypothetical protein n=1 Tax=Synechococcus sp. (strain ATCC 29403 / PCC 7335) TaxID=91464 RepID=UPI00017ECA8F|nr:hypothetical protein [Synechococcus sp. PCC 7335]EDX86639.1 hypothetical protein S7335_4344 [Synechococcus sp. PCC 7335]